MRAPRAEAPAPAPRRSRCTPRRSPVPPPPACTRLGPRISVRTPRGVPARRSAARAFCIALAITGGIGSVVSPMPMLRMRTPGFFSACSRRRLAICPYTQASVVDGTSERTCAATAAAGRAGRVWVGEKAPQGRGSPPAARPCSGCASPSSLHARRRRRNRFRFAGPEQGLGAQAARHAPLGEADARTTQAPADLHARRQAERNVRPRSDGCDTQHASGRRAAPRRAARAAHAAVARAARAAASGA